jgi:hypothetical protein
MSGHARRHRLEPGGACVCTAEERSAAPFAANAKTGIDMGGKGGMRDDDLTAQQKPGLVFWQQTSTDVRNKRNKGDTTT